MINAASTHSAILSVQNKYKKQLPEDFDLGDYQTMLTLAENIKERHLPIAEYLDGHGDIGNVLMYHDSEIINRVMLHFAEKSVASLPVHDSLIVPLKDVPELRNALTKISRSPGGCWRASLMRLTGLPPVNETLSLLLCAIKRPMTLRMPVRTSSPTTGKSIRQSSNPNGQSSGIGWA